MYRAKCKKKYEQRPRQFIELNQLLLIRGAKKQGDDPDICRSNHNGEKHVTKIHPKNCHKRHQHKSRHRRPIEIIVPMEEGKIMQRGGQKAQVKLPMQKAVRQIIEIGTSTDLKWRTPQRGKSNIYHKGKYGSKKGILT